MIFWHGTKFNTYADIWKILQSSQSIPGRFSRQAWSIVGITCGPKLDAHFAFIKARGVWGGCYKSYREGRVDGFVLYNVQTLDKRENTGERRILGLTGLRWPSLRQMRSGGIPIRSHFPTSPCVGGNGDQHRLLPQIDPMNCRFVRGNKPCLWRHVRWQGIVSLK